MKVMTKENPMKKLFRKYCSYLSQDREKSLQPNPFDQLKKDYKEGRMDFYDFLNEMHKYNKSIFFLSQHISNTNIAKIEISENNVIFTTKTEGIKLLFDGKDRRGVPFEILNWGNYEKEEFMLFDKILHDGMCILDVGANLGWYSLVWGKKYKNALIHAFEPIPQIHRYCIANSMINGLDNIQIHNLALSDYTGEETFFYAPESAALSSEKNVMEYENAEPVPVKVDTLDAFTQRLDLQQIDVIKCDVEGAEFNCMKGGIHTITKNLPIIILELYHEWSVHFNYHPDTAISFLKDLGYDCFLPYEGQLEEIENYQSEDFNRQNYFFLHQIKHTKLIKNLLLHS